MNYPERDLSCQYISSSFQDVLQQYVSSDLLYVLDGYGNVVFSLPSSSIGQTIITSDVTASITVLSSSYAQSSSLATISLTSDFALLSGNAINTISASYALTSAYALNYNKIPHKTITANYSLTNNDYLIYASASSTNIVLIMPTPSSVPEQIFKIKKIDSTGYEVIISSSVNIDYDTELRLSQRGSSVTLHSNGTQYWIH